MINNENTNQSNNYEHKMAAQEINSNDVLCGRGGLTNSHVGNKRFRDVVSEYQMEYLKARKNDKKDIARKIVARIDENGGRFLQRSQSSDDWCVATEKRALEKTSQALREGLDVRHKKFRKNKPVRKRGRKTSGSGTRARKQDNVAKGVVIQSPKTTMLDFRHDVPDLVSDESPANSFEPMFTFFPQTAMDHVGMISEEDCDNVLQI